ncbi:endolytic transglycosylase MltG [Bacillus thermotolerans]|uniref:Endolytic murein transglycosylase n=1 Tax=Bacillus thermotolerans TaxID=1221996 RepID=A0A0F5ICH1_BACTR|nr:endolytic transglycosylase MltG [Bacillus thermotolerans]KKB36378.1 YceG like protein [Bacillus thermotolerans]KKB43153.1 protein YceG like [Bacillus thermotolerans]KKB43556.1 YceG like protein [Bacillus thermotolerans]
MSKQSPSRPTNNRRRVKKAIFAAIVLFLLIVGGLAAGGYFFVQSALEPVDPNDDTPIQVDIPLGSSLSVIAETLDQEGVVKSAEVFKYYVKYKNEEGLQAGQYTFTPNMTLDEIISSLKTGKVTGQGELEIIIPEGYQLTQIAAEIAKKTGVKEEEVLTLMNDKAFIQEMIQKYPNLLTEEVFAENIKYPLEGYLYPATYHYDSKEKPIKEIVEEMIKKTDSVLAQYRSSMEAKQMTAHKLLTMSSLIEEEATEKADRRKISSVFYNRLDKGMPLQTDPTVLYALGEHKSRVLYKDLEVDSPYNTYKVTGLTPGPIGNSGVSSMEAALNPEETDFLYFLASPEGDVYYSKTLQEHNRLKEKYITSHYEGQQ